MKNFILVLKALAIVMAFCLFGEARAEFEEVPVPRDGFKAEYSQEVENYPALRGMNLALNTTSATLRILPHGKPTSYAGR